MVNDLLGFLGFGRIGRAHIDRNIPIRDVRYVVFDTELTGLDEKKDSIVSIGALKMHGGRIELGNTFYRLVNPEKKLTAESVVIHGITPSDVEAKPEIVTVIKEFLDFCGKDVVVGHCVSIDLLFVDKIMKKLLGHALHNAAVDTFSLYGTLRKKLRHHRAFVVPLRDFRLYEMSRRFGVPLQGAHNAIMDAYITAQLFQRFIPMLVEAGINTLGDLLKAGDPSKGGDSNSYAGEAGNF